MECNFMKKYTIKIRQEIVHRTDNLQEALRAVTSLFNKGHEEISLHGGRLGSWR